MSLKPAPGDDKHASSALSATRTESGETYIFYFDSKNKICYLKGSGTGSYAEYSVSMKNDGVSTAAVGDTRTLTSTLFDQEQASLPLVHVYYVQNDYIKAAWWHVHDGEWRTGLINAKGYKVTRGTGISSLGQQELHGKPGQHRLEVYFNDQDNEDKFSVAYFKDKEWHKAVVEV
ncbi:uncharacterized protein G6M90_00g108120 [Metarhizium brunneum]|uniref:Fucose-specific lectin n=1 Tax=Metarhizium brunneum TaxID=500148 RepID=A0A7D5V598_9HYPO|nr:hypothetical protein G6M90_00g108120 [Metarhizium brunneum]